MDLQSAKFDQTTHPKTLLNYNRVFVTEKYLGSGGFGFVYLIKGIISNQLYAIKLSSDPLTKEATILEMVSKYPKCNQFISCYYDYFQLMWEGKNVYGILMEYINGTDFQKIKHDKLKIFTVDEIFNVADYLFTGLSYIHHLGIVHGDVSAKNVILTKDGDIKIIDFGEGCLLHTDNDSMKCHIDDTDIDEGLEFHFNDIQPDSPLLLDNLALYFKTKDVHNAAIMLFELIINFQIEPYQENKEGRLSLIKIQVDTHNPYLNAVVNGAGIIDPFQRLNADEALYRLHREWNTI